MGLHQVFPAVGELSPVAASGDCALVVVRGFSLRWLFLLQSVGSGAFRLHSVVVVRALLPCAMWDLPGPGIEPVFPALAGRFLTTVPPRKSVI